jgi:hypothetical protein
MECVSNGSIIITLAIQTHGKVIDLNLSPNKNNIFNDVRLFSKSGEFVDVVSSPFQDKNILRKVNDIFQTNLNKPSLDSMNEYVKYSHPIYKRFVEESKTNINNENVCRLIDNITFDKAFSTNLVNDGNPILCLVDKLLDLINPEFNGIFIVSVHEKINNDEYNLIYPYDSTQFGTNLNLLKTNDLMEFASLFNNQNIINSLIQQTTALPTNEYTVSYDTIMKNKNITEYERKQMLNQMNREYYEILQQWNVTLKNSQEIQAIKMSYLVGIIKQIVGPKCKVNILDYSCNSISRSIPEADLPNIKYLVPSDVENPGSKSWGGEKLKKTKKKKRRTKRKKSRRK